MKPLQPPALVLPKLARDRLILASQVANPTERRLAIDAAIDFVQLHYPEFFRHTPLIESNKE